MDSADPRPLITSTFAIEGDTLDPEEVTRLIGVEPTETGLIGMKRSAGRPDAPTSYWWLKIRKQPDYDIEPGIARILDILWPQREKVVRFLRGSDFAAIFTTGVSIYQDRPIYSLGPDTLRRLSYFDVRYCIDIFDYTE